MPTACITTPGARVRLDGGRLQVRHEPRSGGDGSTDSETPARNLDVPIREIDRLLISEDVSVSGAVLAEMMRREIPVCWLDGRGRFLGSFQPAPPAHGASRLRQYQRAQDPEFARIVTGRIVAAKVYNQRRVLQRVLLGRRRHLQQRHQWERRDGDLHFDEPEPQAAATVERDHALITAAECVDWLDALFKSLGKATSVDELRGYEGAAAARYFKAWETFLPDEFPFERRSTRPPHNPVNACISFAATMVYQEMVAAIHARGLDPAIGFLHTTENGRWSLALDLMEPFRPVLVEPLALDLLSHAMLKQDDFESRDGGVFLTATGRRKLILQYERRMDRQFMSESAGHRTTLRQQLDAQAVMLKSALDDLSKFEPFLIN
jgi:CRISPR-associated protein Cas1